MPLCYLIGMSSTSKNYTTMKTPFAHLLKHPPLGVLQTLGIALEDNEDGVAAKEIEYMWYGRLTDFEALKKAAGTETQKQSSLKGKGGTIRVRETTAMGQLRYTLTAKAYSGYGEANECSLPVSKDMHEVFKVLSGESMDKIRYTFPIEGTELKWEVDVFIDAQGNPKDWVKIDLEVPERINEWPPLPVPLTDVIFAGNDEYTREQRAKLDELFATVFVNKV